MMLIDLLLFAFFAYLMFSKRSNTNKSFIYSISATIADKQENLGFLSY
jgi:hypothetical protein